jgi:hypothetical protein
MVLEFVSNYQERIGSSYSQGRVRLSLLSSHAATVYPPRQRCNPWSRTVEPSNMSSSSNPTADALMVNAVKPAKTSLEGSD